MIKFFIIVNKMFYYQVNIKVDIDIKESYRSWLIEHIDEMCKLPCILGYSLDEEDAFLVTYHLESEKEFQRYLNEYAKSMRTQVPDEFIGKFKITRSTYSS